MSIMIENQLINKNICQYYDNINEVFIELTQSNIEKYYDKVYVLCKKNNEPIPIEFYDLNVNKDIYEKVLSNLIIYKVSISIILNTIKHFNSIIILSDNDIQQFNIFNYSLDIKNIVLPILNINFSDLSIYLDQYNITNTIDNLYKLKLMNYYLEVKNNNSDYYCNIIDEMKESKYWVQHEHTPSTLDRFFKERKIYFDVCRLKNQTIVNEIKSSLKSNIKLLSEKEDYIKDIGTKNNYIDLACLNNYSIENKPDISYNDFNKLFDSLDEKQQFLLFTNSMVSKNYVHLVINNKHILEIMIPRMLPMTCLFKYLLSYSWIMFYYEECIKKTNTKTNDTFVFDIDTASLLPVFPFILSKPKENPYMPLLISDEELDPGNNIGGTSEYDTNDKLYMNGGICCLIEFNFRMNIFCTGNYNYNIFEDFDFKKYNVAISGSIMTACLQRNHPLMNIFTNQNNRFVEYFNEHYPDSDIDVMFIAKDIKTFITNVNIFYNQINTNILKINKSTDAKLSLNKLGYLFVSEEFISKNIDKEPSKIRWIKKNINTEEVLILFKPFYEELKDKKYKELVDGLTKEEIEKLEKEFHDIYKTFDVEFKVYINKKSSKDIDLIYTYKYKITSSFLKHPLELFKIKHDDFISCVSQFHLPCVRAYYNGNAYVLPSCISAHLTYMNIDFKYMFGSTDIIEIFNKNRLRGFGIWLNKTEIDMIHKYYKNICYKKNMMDIKGYFGGNISLFGEPIKYSIVNINNNKYKMNNLKQYPDNLSYVEILKKRYNINIDDIYNNLTAIDNNGYIKPLQKWIINYAYNRNEIYKTPNNVVVKYQNNKIISKIQLVPKILVNFLGLKPDIILSRPQVMSFLSKKFLQLGLRKGHETTLDKATVKALELDKSYEGKVIKFSDFPAFLKLFY